MQKYTRTVKRRDSGKMMTGKHPDTEKGESENSPPKHKSPYHAALGIGLPSNSKYRCRLIFVCFSILQTLFGNSHSSPRFACMSPLLGDYSTLFRSCYHQACIWQ